MADGMVTASYNQLRQRMAGPFRIMKVHPHTVVVEEDDIPSSVSIHQTTAAHEPDRKHHALKSGHARQSDSSQPMSDSQRQQNGRAFEDVASEANSQTEYAV